MTSMKPTILIMLLLGGPALAGAAQDNAAKQAAATKEKETYVHKADKEVQDLNSKVKTLEEQSQNNGAQARSDLDRHLKAIHVELNKARQKLIAIRASSENAWKSLQSGLERTLADVQRHYNKAVESTKPAAKALKKT